jgi:hypothetical protein
MDGQFIDELTMAVILAAPAKPVQVDAAEP